MSTKKLTQQDFLDKCKKRHGNRFDYSNAIYINATTKVEIKCSVCQHSWNVIPSNHYFTGSGCPNCKAISSKKRNKAKYNNDWFIKKAILAHGLQYDYSSTQYLDNNTKVTIKCHQHGIFKQWPSDHMRGIGCSKCSGNNKKSNKQFIAEALAIFPKYDYSLVDYKGAHIPVTIICPEHGTFKIKPNGILNKTGCGKCSTSRQLTTKIQKGIIRNPDDISDYEKYRAEVWKISNREYQKYYYQINPTNVRRGLKNHLDHKYSIQQGWQNKIPAIIIGGWKNLQILSSKLNQQKSNKCSVLLEDIL